MGNPFDQLAKKIGIRALGPAGRTDAQHEIHANARHADLRHEPDPAREAERARLGLLGRLASVLCLIELFSSVPSEEKVLHCLGKLITYRQERRREATKAKRRMRERGDAQPAAPFVKPVLWVICAGRPTSAMSLLGAVRAEGWPPGVYLMPAAPPTGGSQGQPAALRAPDGLCVGFVVASELPAERDTLLVRMMAGGAALSAALEELAALPAGAYEREVASADVLELRRMLGQKTKKTKEEETFIVSTESIVDQLREEGRREGRVEEAARAVLTVLRVRGIGVPDAARERVLGQRDPQRLERWLEIAAVAASVDDVLREPS